jgi:hypothetical protein
MAIYVDFTFYSDEYLGSKISIDEFDSYALQASARIDQLTFDRTAAIIEDGTDTDTVNKIQLATCAVADELLTQSKNGSNGQIQSESVGQHSVTYALDSTRSNAHQLRNAAKLFLSGTGLMFPGFNTGEYGNAH